MQQAAVTLAPVRSALARSAEALMLALSAFAEQKAMLPPAARQVRPLTVSPATARLTPPTYVRQTNTECYYGEATPCLPSSVSFLKGVCTCLPQSCSSRLLQQSARVCSND